MVVVQAAVVGAASVKGAASIIAVFGGTCEQLSLLVLLRLDVLAPTNIILAEFDGAQGCGLECNEYRS